MNFSPHTGIAILCRKCITKFRQNKRKRIPDDHFSRVVTTFKENGSFSDGQTSNKRVPLSGDKIEDVRKHFLMYPFLSK